MTLTSAVSQPGVALGSTVFPWLPYHTVAQRQRAWIILHGRALEDGRFNMALPLSVKQSIQLVSGSVRLSVTTKWAGTEISDRLTEMAGPD